MIYAVTGERNSGKTQLLSDIYLSILKNADNPLFHKIKEEIPGVRGLTDSEPEIPLEKFSRPGGFLSLKTYSASLLIGYDILDIRKAERFPFIRMSAEEEYDFTLGPFYFFSSGFKTAERILIESREAHADIFFIDEIGRMELAGNGYTELFSEALISFENIIFTVRTPYLEDIIKKFGIKNVRVIKTGGLKGRRKNQQKT